MLEKQESIEVRLSLRDDETGELHNVEASKKISSKYYNIKKLNKRICVNDLFSIQSKVCSGSKSILVFRDLLLVIDKYNELRVNVTKFAEKNNYTRSQVTKMISDWTKYGLAIKIDRGVYLINPFAFQSIGSTNSLIEEAQIKWKELSD